MGSHQHGNFSTVSAWNLIRHHNPHTETFEAIWSPALTPSISIFVWRLLANRVPVDTKLQWRKVQPVSKCRCCIQPKIESREHLFIRGEAAKKIWMYYAEWFTDYLLFPGAGSDIEYRIGFCHHLTSQRTCKHHHSVPDCVAHLDGKE